MIHDMPHKRSFFPTSTFFGQKNAQRGNYSEDALEEPRQYMLYQNPSDKGEIESYCCNWKNMVQCRIA